MLILNIDCSYCKFPESISTIETFMSYVTEHYHSFIPLLQYEEGNCVFPYLIEEETKTVYINVATIEKIYTEDVTIIPTRKEYDERLKKVVQEKCIHCVHYEEDLEEDNLSGHRNFLSLDGECYRYEKSTD